MDQDKEEEQMDEEDKATNKNTQNQKGRRRRRRVRTPGNTKNMAGMVVSEPTDIVERSREILGLRSRRVGKRLAILMVFNGLPKRKKEKPREVKKVLTFNLILSQVQETTGNGVSFW